ncbi:MAG: DUF4331 family protein [Polyangiaceae bacterium]
MKRKLIVLSLVGISATASQLFAADHLDGPAAKAEPTADITDLYAWMESDTSKVNLILDVSPMAGAGAKFSNAVVYVFHVNSSAGYGMAQTETKVTCQFYDADHIECWAGDEYVTGDPSSEAGITSDGGKMKVFAGMRNDPFFFEFVGFTETVKAVKAAAPSLKFDSDGCPAVDAATSAVLVKQLQSGANGAAASDTFATTNVLSIVVQIDKSILTKGGPLLGVWASTHKAQ